MKELARKSALSVKAADNKITIVEDFTFAAPKTKDFVKFAKNLKVEGEKLLLVLADQNKNVFLSARNVPDTRLMIAKDINTYAVLNNNAIILTESSLAVINNL